MENVIQRRRNFSCVGGVYRNARKCLNGNYLIVFVENKMAMTGRKNAFYALFSQQLSGVTASKVTWSLTKTASV